MGTKSLGYRWVFYYLVLMGYFLSNVCIGNCITSDTVQEQVPVDSILKQDNDINTMEIREMNSALQTLLEKGDLYKSRMVVDKIIKKTDNNNIIDSMLLSDSYYYIGIYYLFVKNYKESVRYLKLSAGFRQGRKEFDDRFAKTLYNLGLAFNGLGDFSSQENYSLYSLEAEKKIYGESSPLLIGTYSSLIIAYIELQEYEKSLSYATIALNIANNNPEVTSSNDLADLYNNIGVIYLLLADYSKAKIYLEKSESLYQSNRLILNDNYINLLNSLAISYGALGLSEISNDYYERGISLALSNNSTLAYNNIYNYSIILGNNGNRKKGEALLLGALQRAKNKFGENSQSYIAVLNNYAEYLREYKIDNERSLEYYKLCMDYFSRNKQDISLIDPVRIGYSLSLAEGGYQDKALETIQSLLFSETEDQQQKGFSLYENPGIENIKADKKSLRILKTKYKIIWEKYKISSDLKTLEAASKTAELIVKVLEKIRINISEEESRLVLGDRYRDSYINAIRDFNLLYSKTSDVYFLKKAFEFSEKSKVAGLLASTRELKASQFNIPAEIADFEKRIQRDLSLINARISEELVSANPDTTLINKWKENILASTRKRDSLILVFETQYPEYYSFKYNTKVAELNDIPEIIGRNGNYLNYVVSDTLLYIFIANRKNHQLISVPIDSSFYSKIRQFRSLLSMPSPSENARIAFEDFQSIGYELYKTIFVPVRPYLISGKLLISPDNILSYLPFETMPTSRIPGGRLLYSQVAYLMNDFDISYTYSATFMAESVKRDYSIRNKVVAFAPNYPEPIDIRSVLKNRQEENGKILDLPYARQEARYVSDITNGILYENSEAIESVYKAESGKFDIIHLAMHTILNDKDPMYSTLIFSPGKDTIDDKYLKTYEVYGIPLKAKMVVLSSCNTGTGLLNSGEGILSLARGFIYSGSESVVMSMWEIEDRSGTEIVKRFYDNLKKGYSKSRALRKSRIDYLKNADQLRSHPYFWSALVIYGNTSPLYYPKFLIVLIPLVVGISCMLIYLWNRKYS